MQPNSLANQFQNLIPPNNYLWKSPQGIAYPGWHHQLILHLAAYNQGVWSNPNLADIKARLTQYPAYAMDENSLNAILQEYLQFNLPTRWAYRDMEVKIPAYTDVKVNVQTYRGDQTSPNADMMGVNWENILDPALFDHSDQSSTPSRGPGSSPLPPSGSTTATQYSEAFSKPIGRNVAEHESPVNTLHLMFDRRLKQLTNLNTAPTTPTKMTSVSTPSKPYPDRFVNRQDRQPISPTPGLTSSQSPIDRDIGRILFFSKGIHNSRQNSMAETTIDSEAEKTRLPDPTKYIQTSKKHYTIPESEAAAFVHWFESKVDALPDKIEGYYWYCDKCYVGEITSEKGGNIRGKYNQRRSVEKHFEVAHRIAWKPVLPELDRSVAMGSIEVNDGNYGPASRTLRRKLFNDQLGPGQEARSRRARKGVNGSEQTGIGGPVTKVKRRGAEVRLDFADINYEGSKEAN